MKPVFNGHFSPILHPYEKSYYHFELLHQHPHIKTPRRKGYWRKSTAAKTLEFKHLDSNAGGLPAGHNNLLLLLMEIGKDKFQSHGHKVEGNHLEREHEKNSVEKKFALKNGKKSTCKEI